VRKMELTEAEDDLLKRLDAAAGGEVFTYAETRSFLDPGECEPIPQDALDFIELCKTLAEEAATKVRALLADPPNGCREAPPRASDGPHGRPQKLVPVTVVLHLFESVGADDAEEHVRFFIEENHCIDNYVERLSEEIASEPGFCHTCYRAETYLGHLPFEEVRKVQQGQEDLRASAAGEPSP